MAWLGFSSIVAWNYISLVGSDGGKGKETGQNYGMMLTRVKDLKIISGEKLLALGLD